ncbi:hypothetical protein [Nakamurella sp.]|uniref:hypothetical protein n=1 Tax=Nakamurella sp. TaxID=1869182 RepID=UPI003784F6A3
MTLGRGVGERVVGAARAAEPVIRLRNRLDGHSCTVMQTLVEHLVLADAGWFDRVLSPAHRIYAHSGHRTGSLPSPPAERGCCTSRARFFSSDPDTGEPSRHLRSPTAIGRRSNCGKRPTAWHPPPDAGSAGVESVEVNGWHASEPDGGLNR